MDESENTTVKQQIEEIEKECEKKIQILNKRVRITNIVLFVFIF